MKYFLDLDNTKELSPADLYYQKKKSKMNFFRQKENEMRCKYSYVKGGTLQIVPK